MDTFRDRYLSEVNLNLAFSFCVETGTVNDSTLANDGYRHILHWGLGNRPDASLPSTAGDLDPDRDQ